MPLHLLGKKSWNVYNKENVARVRRDEAQAKVQEEEAKRREQEADAEKRIQILRGQREATPPTTQEGLVEDSSVAPKERREHGDSRHRKRRRVAGENDTDRDIRIAKEDAEQTDANRRDVSFRKPSSDAPVVDDAGHISLFPVEQSSKKKKRVEKNPEAEAEEAKKNREYEDQYTMRFSNAAGFKQGMEQPWYSSGRQELLGQADMIPSKDVWGNEDPRRRERETRRTSANDPLATMKKGVRQLREVEKERENWEEERQRELHDLKREQRESGRHRRRRSARSPDSLEGFRLDDDVKDDDRRRSHRSHRHRDKERHSKHSRFPSSRRKRNSDTRHPKSRRPSVAA